MSPETNPLLESKKTIERLQRLVELSGSLNSTLKLDDLLNTIIDTAADILDCEAGSILLVDEKSGDLFFAAASGGNIKQLSEIPVPLYDSLAGTIFRKDEPMILNMVENDPRHNKEASSKVGFQPQSLLGVPLKIRDRKIGVLEVLNKRKGLFDEEDAQLLGVVASQAAVGIHNAQLVQALKKAYDEVSKADQLKSNFLAVASHELRTPLGIVIGYATFLREEADGDASEHAEQVLNAALKMRSLLEDMNNLTMLEAADASTLLPRNTLIHELLIIAAQEVQELANAKGQVIDFDLPENDLRIMVDSKKLNAALTNLLHNAIRFSPEKSTIILGTKREGDRLLCWVKDEGIGIPDDELETIFEKFYQVEAPNVRRYDGMGIGLTIARGLVEAQGGKLWAESEGEGKGATFMISLPFREMPAA